MSHRRSLRLVLSIAWAAGIAAASPLAYGDDAKGPACAAARDAAREAEHANHYRHASALLERCSKRPCSDAVRQECTSHYSELEAELPTIVPRVTDPSGATHTDVTVRMDGEVLTQHLGDTPLAVDPGLHEFSFAVGERLCATQRILIAQGAHERGVTVAVGEGGDCRGVAAPQGGPGPESVRNGFVVPKDKRACLAAREAAEARQQAGHLREALNLLATCANHVCGKAMFQQCTLAFEQLDADIPTVIPRVTDGDGATVQVKMDGEILTARLDGQALPVDPGLHEFSFVGPSGVVATRKVMVAEGVHDLEITVSMHEAPSPAGETPVASTAPSGAAPAPAAPAGSAPAASAVPEIVHDEGDRPRGGSTPVAWVLGGVGLAGIGVGAAFMVTGPHSRWNVAIAGGALGIGALTAGIWLLASGHPPSDKAPEHAHVTFDVAPTTQGGFASVSGTF